MTQIAGDVRSGLRLLVKYPTLSLVAVLTLGLSQRSPHSAPADCRPRLP